jgi:ABC-type multidrug transport system permease subunit
MANLPLSVPEHTSVELWSLLHNGYPLNAYHMALNKGAQKRRMLGQTRIKKTVLLQLIPWSLLSLVFFTAASYFLMPLEQFFKQYTFYVAFQSYIPSS